MTRTKEEIVLLAVSGGAAAAAILAVREATPASLGLWVATAGALALALAGLFAFWFGGAARQRVADSVQGESDAARNLLSALPDGLLIVREGEICSVNRSLCDQLGFDREDLVGSSTPFPFWPPEYRHEIEVFHTDLAARGEHVAELTFAHKRGDRLRVLVSGRLVVDDRDGLTRQLVTVRDFSASHRREQRLTELAARDAQTGLLDRREFEERLGEAVRRALTGSTNVTIVLAELSIDGRADAAVFARPEALLAVDRFRRGLRAGDALARTGDGELGWILPETDAGGGLEAIDRWRAEMADLHGVVLTTGVCDLASAGDTFALYALADRALASARRRGRGSTDAHVTTALPVLPPPA
jgi:PAS domain S-box-containing protein